SPGPRRSFTAGGRARYKPCVSDELWLRAPQIKVRGVAMHKINRWLLCAFLFLASLAHGQGCNNRFVVFGDSLTDPGNAFLILGVISTPPFSLVPSAPYASHTFSNGPVWAQQLANSLQSPDSGAPALASPGVFTNYAVGAARARP